VIDHDDRHSVRFFHYAVHFSCFYQFTVLINDPPQG
jgi:hypothetical protein